MDKPPSKTTHSFSKTLFFFSLLFFLLFLFPFSAFADREVRLGPEGEHLRPVKYAEIEISGQVPETLPEIYMLRPDTHTLEDLLRRINAAVEDKAIEGIIIRLGPFGGGWAKANEIRSAMQNAAEKGKEVIVFLEHGGNLEYYLAAGADRIVMPPASALMLVGLRGEVMFLKELFDKVGINPDFIQVGKYKGAADPFVDRSASEEFEESMNALLDSLFDQFVEKIAAGRGLEAEAVKELIDMGPFTTEGALEEELIDSVAFHHELIGELRKSQEAPFELVSGYAREEPDAIPLGEGAQQLLRLLLGMRADLRREPMPEGNIIAIVNMVGPVVMQRPDTMLMGDSVIDARLMIRILQELRENPDVKAVVLRVQSPGGDAQAGDLIWDAVRRLDQVKPVVSSISDVAGSGGYYIACAGRYVFASESSLTGSIGVMGGKFVIKDLLDKLGIHVEVFERGQHSGLFSPFETFSESQRERFSNLLEDTYDTFLNRVSESRGMSQEEVEAVAGGRTFTGKQAMEKNLINETGGLQKAIEHARKLSGIDEDEEVEVLNLPKPQSLLDAILLGRDIGVTMSSGVVDSSRTELLPKATQDGLQYLNAVSLLRDYQPATLMPSMIRVR